MAILGLLAVLAYIGVCVLWVAWPRPGAAPILPRRNRKES